MTERNRATSTASLPMSEDPASLLREFLEKSREFEKLLEHITTVNATDRLVMEHLIQSGPQTPSELAAAVGITPAAMTTSIDRLEELGHAHRAPHTSDRRKLVVTASEKSVGVIMGVLMSMVHDIDALSSEFTADEINAVSAFLIRVNEIYDAHLR